MINRNNPTHCVLCTENCAWWGGFSICLECAQDETYDELEMLEACEAMAWMDFERTQRNPTDKPRRREALLAWIDAAEELWAEAKRRDPNFDAIDNNRYHHRWTQKGEVK